MPFSRSRSIESSTWLVIWRASMACVSSRIRSANVDLPWSTWAMIEKLRRQAWGMVLGRGGIRPRTIQRTALIPDKRDASRPIDRRYSSHGTRDDVGLPRLEAALGPVSRQRARLDPGA